MMERTGYKIHLLEWVIVGMMLRLWDIWVSGRSNFPKLFVKALMGRFFLKKYFRRVAYKKIKIEDGIDVKV